MTSQDPGPKGPGQFRMILRYKLQASSFKLQATSYKHQAPSNKQLTSVKLSDSYRIIKEKL